MKTILNFLFPSKPDENNISLFLLGVRLVFGILLLTHGLQKFENYDMMAESFPDPLGIGHQMSLNLAIFGELICAVGFILGFLFRLALIPMIITMAVAFFVIHGADPFAVKELAFVYLAIFILMYFIGPGKYALDRMVVTSLKSKKE